MWPLFLITVVAQLLKVCLSQTEEEAGSLSYVSNECNSKMAYVDSLESFDKFMKHYHVAISCCERPKRGILNRAWGLRKCYDLEEELLALEELIHQQDGKVCQNDYINRLVDYHFKYVAKQSYRIDEFMQSSAADAKPSAPVKVSYASRVFSLFAHQVAYTCKGKLLQRVKRVHDRQDCSAVLGSFMPVDIIKEATSSSKQTPAGQQEESKFVAFLKNFKRVEDFALMFIKTDKMGPYYSSIVAPEVLDKINNLKGLCRICEPYYRALFGPIATLSQLGYNVEESSVDSKDLDSNELKLLKSWLATAQLCQGVLRTHVSTPEQGEVVSTDDGENGKMVEIKFGELPEDVANDERKLSSSSFSNRLPDSMDFHDSVSEITSNIKELVRRKSSFNQRVKRRALDWAKNFIGRHMNIDAKRSEMGTEFVRALTRGNDETDAPVAFNGKYRNHGLYNPGKLVADDADTIITSMSLFIHKEIAILLSSVVGISLSAVFLWFTLYALVSNMRSSHGEPDTNGNFKEGWRELRAQRVKNLDEKIKRKGWLDKMTVYKSKTA